MENQISRETNDYVAIVGVKTLWNFLNSPQIIFFKYSQPCFIPEFFLCSIKKKKRQFLCLLFVLKNRLFHLLFHKENQHYHLYPVLCGMYKIFAPIFFAIILHLGVSTNAVNAITTQSTLTMRDFKTGGACLHDYRALSSFVCIRVALAYTHSLTLTQPRQVLW
jgi:hypothetical protein